MSLPVLDLHTHTIASGNATGSLAEMRSAADSGGLLVLGISDSGPALAGAPGPRYFRLSKELSRSHSRLRLMFGCEANIVGPTGQLDLPPSVLAELDYVIAGIHSDTSFDPANPADRASALIGAMESGLVDIISHPVTNITGELIELIVRHAALNDVAVEVSCRDVRHAPADQLAAYQTLLAACAVAGCRVLFGSDALVPEQVGDWTALTRLDLPEQLAAYSNEPVRAMAWLHQRAEHRRREAAL